MKLNTDFSRSTELLKKAKELIPTASQTYSKSYMYFCEGAAPAFMERGNGARVWDVDGNEYVDFVLGLGAITVGYNNPTVNAAIKRQLAKGISFSQPSPVEVELALKLTQIIPCAQMVKLVKNGSDATSAAVKLARAHTGRDMVLCSGYHGTGDWYIGTTTNSRGVPEGVKKFTATFKYNDIEGLKAVFAKYPGQVAAVILEPMQGDGPAPGYLEALRQLTHENGALLIFDEVVSGFRMGIGGAQGHFKVTPDLSAFGKGMGNGMSISALVGRRDVMKLIDEGVFISSTFGGEALAIAASLAAIGLLEKPESFRHIWALGERWTAGARRLVAEKGLAGAAKVTGAPPHCGMEFSDSGNL